MAVAAFAFYSGSDAVSSSPASGEWPSRLQKKHGLQLDRAQGFILDRTVYAVVGFDGREDGYICWAAQSGTFNTATATVIPRWRAHNAERIKKGEMPRLPPLPELSHTGRLEDESASQKRPPPSSPPPQAAQQLPTSPRKPQQTDKQSRVSSRGSIRETSDQLVLYNPSKKCVLCSLLRVLISPFVALCQKLGVQEAAAATPAVAVPESTPLNEDSGGMPRQTTLDSARKGQELVVYSKPPPPVSDRRTDAFEDMRITIPIVKPPSWQEVEPVAHRIPMVFDERGVKETMTVKMSRWENFVDRQKEKLGKEVENMRQQFQQDQESEQANGESHEPEREPPAPLEDDISELERMVERMDDWKDLSRYSGKSINMASTRRGNEMKIHIMAFAEKEDGSGVDFMRLSYKKSVEIREGAAKQHVRSALGPVSQTLRFLLPFAHDDHRAAREVEDRWVRLLQQPDIAKFTIALAFRSALAQDGVHLNFCEARLDDLGD